MIRSCLKSRMFIKPTEQGTRPPQGNGHVNTPSSPPTTTNGGTEGVWLGTMILWRRGGSHKYMQTSIAVLCCPLFRFCGFAVVFCFCGATSCITITQIFFSFSFSSPFFCRLIAIALSVLWYFEVLFEICYAVEKGVISNPFLLFCNPRRKSPLGIGRVFAMDFPPLFPSFLLPFRFLFWSGFRVGRRRWRRWGSR